MAIHSLQLVNNVLDALITAATITAIISLVTTMVMGIVMLVSTTSREKEDT